MIACVCAGGKVYSARGSFFFLFAFTVAREINLTETQGRGGGRSADYTGNKSADEAEL